MKTDEDKTYNTLYDLLNSYCKEINEWTDADFNITTNSDKDYPYFRIFRGDTLLTGGDCYDVEERLKQIARENGIDLNAVNLDDFINKLTEGISE